MTIYGVHTGLQRTSTKDLIALWQRVERNGYGWISIWDHFYSADFSHDADCLEAVSMHAALALSTSKVTCGSLVYSVGYRHPAVLANMAITIDHLADGRMALGLGAGWSYIEYEAYGIPFPGAGTRMDQLEEALACVRGLLDNDETNFAGQWFTMTHARCEPKSVQSRIPIWIGGGGERRTLRITARWADGWNLAHPSPETFAAKRDVLHRHCEDIGRDPAQIACAVNLGIARDEQHLRAQYGKMHSFASAGVLQGSDEQVLDRINQYIERGADQINFTVRAPFDPEDLDRLASLLKL
jgi:alkanesulfonate monooxygenase SsuD/methylene tetrahydromethanopterin reductase-like flavin-dependent oxidoreductase (luciferase family)